MGRIISLHTELRYLLWKFGKVPFGLQQMKFDPSSEKTQLDFFPLAASSPRYGTYKGKYDPYLNNPLDQAGFHLTQGVEKDSQKSKAASACFDSLEALGWILRLQDGRGVVTAVGQRIAKLEYEDRDFLPLMVRSVSNYGPAVGFLFECIRMSVGGIFRRSDVKIGYENTGESLNRDGRAIHLSLGSEEDSITRTRSVLIAWAMTIGWIWPINEEVPKDPSLWHVAALRLIKEKKWSWSKFKILVPLDYFSARLLTVSHPLSYQWMTKSTKALRERGQGDVRMMTLQVEERVKNRRFAIVYSIAVAAAQKKKLDLEAFLREMRTYPHLFVIDAGSFDRVMEQELKIAIASGVVFTVEARRITPLAMCDLVHLSIGVPEGVMVAVEAIIDKSLKV